MSDGTHYTVPGISDTVTQDLIDRAYRSLVEAYRVLSDSTQRSSYDQQLALHRQQYTPTPTAPPRAALTCPLYPEVFSKQIGCSVDEAKDFLAGRLPITPALARKLQSEFGSSLEFLDVATVRGGFNEFLHNDGNYPLFHWSRVCCVHSCRSTSVTDWKKVRRSHRVNYSESYEGENPMRKLPTLDMSGDTYYAVLGIPETATQDQIKRAYRRLIKRVHPDKFPNASSYWKRAVEQESKKVIEAYYVLSDSTQRLSYDQQLASYRQQHSPTPSLRPKAATTSPPRSYTSQPNPRPQPRAAVRRSWASWAFLAGILVLASAVLLGYVFSGSNDFQPSKSKAAFAAGTQPARESPGFPSSSRGFGADMIKRFCNENTTSSYHFFASSVLLSGSCSDWLRQNQSSVEGESLKTAGGSDKTKAKSAKQQ